MRSDSIPKKWRTCLPVLVRVQQCWVLTTNCWSITVRNKIWKIIFVTWNRARGPNTVAQAARCSRKSAQDVCTRTLAGVCDRQRSWIGREKYAAVTRARRKALRIELCWTARLRCSCDRHAVVAYGALPRREPLLHAEPQQQAISSLRVQMSCNSRRARLKGAECTQFEQRPPHLSSNLHGAAVEYIFTAV